MRLLNALLCDPKFKIDEHSLGYIVRDIINMNWWNTSGNLVGYQNNRRVHVPFTEEQKRIGVQLKEFYRHRLLETRDPNKFRAELQNYIAGKTTALRQLGVWSTPTRANPSQYFTRNGNMTWVDCTSRATYAAKYVFQNGYVDFDGVCRADGMQKLIDWIADGTCTDLGITHLFEDGPNAVKLEVFSQKTEQNTVAEWTERLGLTVLPQRRWLFDAIAHVRTDPYKIFEAQCVSEGIAEGIAEGVNECLYGLKTMASVGGEIKKASLASATSKTSDARHASCASLASAASNASRASHASRASDASRASNASNASRASDAGFTTFTGSAWAECDKAISKPDGLEYPLEFRKDIFAMAGHWKIDKSVTALAKLGWFDPFMGHGSSPLYAAQNGIRYVGFDTNARAFDEYLGVVRDAVGGHNVDMRLQDSTEFLPELAGQFDLCYTSPPYFNFEEYGGNTGHYQGCETYDDFHQKISVPALRNVHRYLVDDGVLALQLSTDKSEQVGWQGVAESVGFRLVDSGKTGCEAVKYSKMSKRSQGLLAFRKIA
jgi:SAM-dependent methyltransferase